MTTSRKHLIAALALALPAAALLVSPASAASAGVHHKKHHVVKVHHVARTHHKTLVHKASAHPHVKHTLKKPHA